MKKNHGELQKESIHKIIHTKVKTQWNGGTTWSKWNGNCNALQSESTGTLVSHSNSVSPRTSAFSSHAICLNFTLQPCVCACVYKTHLCTSLFNILRRFTRCIVKAVRLKTGTRLDAPLRMPHNESTKLWCWLDSGGRDRGRVPLRGKGVMSFQVCKRSLAHITSCPLRDISIYAIVSNFRSF